MWSVGQHRKLYKSLTLKKTAHVPIDTLFDGHGQLLVHDDESEVMVSTNSIWSFSYSPQDKEINMTCSWIIVLATYFLLCNGSREWVSDTPQGTKRSEANQNERWVPWRACGTEFKASRGYDVPVITSRRALSGACTLARDVPRLPRWTT